MAKIMLVEDDNNLREIYEARLLAEGYEIISAQDGEEALAMAVKEKPDLIISDVMMPKISGFDMLDILRSTPETRNTKVVIMTALSQAEDKIRADKLGADKYLIKSQVTLEDVANVAREILNNNNVGGATPVASDSSVSPSATAQLTPSNLAPPDPASSTLPITLTPQTPPTTTDLPKENIATNNPTTPTQLANKPKDQIHPNFTSPTVAPITQPVVGNNDNNTNKTVTPATQPPPLNTQPTPPTMTNPHVIDASLTQTTAAEEAEIDKEIDQFINQNPTISSMPNDNNPVIQKTAEIPSAPAVTPQHIEVVSAPADQKANVSEVPADPTKKVPSPDDLADVVNKIMEASTPTAPASNTISTPPATTAGQTTSNNKKDSDSGGVPVNHKKIIQPINNPDIKPDINQLLEKELSNDMAPMPPTSAIITPTGQSIASNTIPDTSTEPIKPVSGEVIDPTHSVT
ncbi:response regulator [Candidatus Saccharibacteria bacterium]|nr:response regulator [Candidatus Saccharibacteria bacterium]MBI3338306.1 response regulator [Candidatus Saccharibacteria bacterium]